MSTREGQRKGCRDGHGSGHARLCLPSQKGGTHVSGFQTLYKWQNPMVKVFLTSTPIIKQKSEVSSVKLDVRSQTILDLNHDSATY